MKYDKLVRDKIPEIIKKDGGDPKFHRASGYTAKIVLQNKLCEEAKEFLEAARAYIINEDDVKLLEELADILEITDAVLRYRGIGKPELKSQIRRILAVKKDKARKRGQFKKKIILDEA